MIKSKWLYSVSCLLLMASLTACGTNKAAGPQPYTRPHTTQVQNTTHPSNMFGYARSTHQAGQPGGQAVTQSTHPAGMPGHAVTHQTHPTAHNQQMAFDTRLAERVASAADSVPGVVGATAIVRGNDVVVGINTRQTNRTAPQLKVIEQQVHAAVRAIAPRHHIRITSDAPMVTRIRSLAQNVRGFGQEMTHGPTTVGSNLANAGNDFATLIRDLGRTVTAPFR